MAPLVVLCQVLCIFQVCILFPDIKGVWQWAMSLPVISTKPEINARCYGINRHEMQFADWTKRHCAIRTHALLLLVMSASIDIRRKLQTQTTMTDNYQNCVIWLFCYIRLKAQNQKGLVLDLDFSLGLERRGEERRGEERRGANRVIRGEESCCWEKDFVLDYFLLLGAYREPVGVLHLSS